MIATWLMVLPAAYFAFGSIANPDASATLPFGALLAAAAVPVINLAFARLPPASLVAPGPSIFLVLAQVSVLAIAWYCGGQQSVELLTCAIAILCLAVAGLTLGELSAATLAMVAVYLVMV